MLARKRLRSEGGVRSMLRGIIMPIKLFVFLIICSFGLAACQTTAIKIGNGPIRLSSKIAGSVENYKLRDSPGYFALANDGRSSFSTYCPSNAASCEDDGGYFAIDACSRKAKKRGSACSIFAIGQKIVWKGEITYPNQSGDYLVLVETSDTEGFGGVVTGRGTINGTKILLRYKDCTGIADLEKKRWSIEGCKKNYSAGGTFEPGTGKVKFIGYGKDSKGNDTEIKLIEIATQTTAASFPASLSAIALCQVALSDSLPSKWNPDSTSVNFVDEAKRRGFSIRDCDSHIGRTSPDTTPIQSQLKSITPVTSSTEIPNPTTSPKPLDKSIEARLEKLRRLVDKGLITEDEAAKKRQEILGGL
jgi:hypothetical protein